MTHRISERENRLVKWAGTRGGRWPTAPQLGLSPSRPSSWKLAETIAIEDTGRQTQLLGWRSGPNAVLCGSLWLPRLSGRRVVRGHVLQVRLEGILSLGGFPQLLELVRLLGALMPHQGAEWVVIGWRGAPGRGLGLCVETVWRTENDRVP